MAATKLTTVQTSVDSTGAFVRKPSQFRDVVSASTGAHYPPATGRYLLYVSLACPWACRCLSLLKMKGLDHAIEVAVVAPVFAPTKPSVDDHEGWVFDTTADPACTVDPVFSAQSVREVYERATEGLDTTPTKFTVPVFFDKVTRRIVNNESSEIIRFLTSEFNAFAKFPEVDTYPVAHREAINAMNDLLYESVNNGVYKCGFAQSQSAYDAAVTTLFSTLDAVDDLLGKQRFLVAGAGLTEADIRLFVTLVRFDPVYVVHFKCSRRFVREYKHLSSYMSDVFQTGKLEGTVNLPYITQHYFRSHTSINKYGIVPVCEPLGLDRPHGREALP